MNTHQLRTILSELALATPAGPAMVGRPAWLSEFVLAETLAARGDEALARNAIRAGLVRRVTRGVYRLEEARRYALAGDVHPKDDAYLARVRAVALTSRAPTVLSHESAALLWGMRLFGEWPARVTVTVPPRTNGTSTADTVRHMHHLDSVDVIDGMRVTTPARTVADCLRTADRRAAFELACTAAFTPRRGAPIVDRAMVHRHLELSGSARGVRRARALLVGVTSGCESPAEARSLHLMLDHGFEVPEQQVRIVDERGDLFADFGWPSRRLIGECDGIGKYLPGGSRTADAEDVERALRRAKRREGRIRTKGWDVTRWSTPVLHDERGFVSLLDTAGVPRRPRAARYRAPAS